MIEKLLQTWRAMAARERRGVAAAATIVVLAILYLGLGTFCLSVLILIYLVAIHLFGFITVPGWTSVLALILRAQLAKTLADTAQG